MSQDRTSCISMPFLVDASLPCSEKQLTEEDGSPAPQMFLPSSSLSSCFFLLSQPGPFLCSSWPLLLVLPAVDVENRWFPPLSTWKLLSCPICPTLPQSKQPKSLPFLFLECVFRSHFLDIFNFTPPSPSDRWLSWSTVPDTGHEIALPAEWLFHVFVVYTSQSGLSPFHNRLTFFTPAQLVIQHSSKILSGRNQKFLIPYLMNFFFLPTTFHVALWNFILFLGQVFNLAGSLLILTLSPIVLAVSQTCFIFKLTKPPMIQVLKESIGWNCADNRHLCTIYKGRFLKSWHFITIP